MRHGEWFAWACLGALTALVLALQAPVACAASVTWATGDGGNGHAYELVETPVFWSQARADASTRQPPSGFQSGQLASIGSAAENAFLAMSFVSGTRTGAWIGFTDEMTEGEWRWLDGTPGIWQDPRNFPSPIQTTYTNWIPGEPNDFATGEDYGLFSCEAGYYPGQWNDGDGPSRGTPFSYIVEYVAVPEPSICISLVAGIAIGSWNTFRRRKHRRALTGLGLALLTALHPAVGSAQNLIRNGSFEAPFASAGIISITPSSVPAGFEWSVDAGSVEVTRHNYIGGTLGNLPFLGAAAEGSQWLDLDGEEVRGGPGTISQAFVTGSGEEYSLTFSYSSNPYRAYPGPAQATVSVIDAVSLAALVAPFQIAHSSSTASDFDWRHSPAATFVATSGSALLRFTSNDLLISDAGVLLDAISVTAVPEPAFCFSLVSVAACSCMMLRGRRRHANAIARGMHAGFMLVILGAPASTALALNYDLVTVGNAGNAADTTGYGAVPYEYKIGKYEVTNLQYAAFLNAAAPTDAFSLYHVGMGTDDRGGITRSGTPGSFTYTVKLNMGNKPVNYVSWFDAARMANWLQNGQGTGGTETGAYTLVGGQISGPAPSQNAGAQFFVPTEDQWYKAAYFNGNTMNYASFSTGFGLTPTAVTANASGDGSAGNSGNFANYDHGASWNGQSGNVTTVGTNGGPSFYGAFDMTGNLWELNDLTGGPGELRGRRGGVWHDTASFLLSSTRLFAPTTQEGDGNGFRLAAPVPEPSALALSLGGIALVATACRRRLLSQSSAASRHLR
jgi:formylglycine-generating enzyme required for sulfatase activity